MGLVVELLVRLDKIDQVSRFRVVWLYGGSYYYSMPIVRLMDLWTTVLADRL